MTELKKQTNKQAEIQSWAFSLEASVIMNFIKCELYLVAGH